jgi:hypothetical protein
MTSQEGIHFIHNMSIIDIYQPLFFGSFMCILFAAVTVCPEKIISLNVWVFILNHFIHIFGVSAFLK